MAKYLWAYAIARLIQHFIVLSLTVFFGYLVYLDLTAWNESGFNLATWINGFAIISPFIIDVKLSTLLMYFAFGFCLYESSFAILGIIQIWKYKLWRQTRKRKLK